MFRVGTGLYRLRLSPIRSGANHGREFAVFPRSRTVTRVDAVTSPADDEKQARLAAALRENLKRRKAQARARRSEASTWELGR